MHAYLNYSVLVNTDFVFSIIPKDQLIEYHKEENNDNCLDVVENLRLTDNEAKTQIIKIAKCKNVSEFQMLDIKKRNSCIHKLHKEGMSIRQISRLTGISKKTVELNI